ncbi:response regulator, partial [Candidatus Poribacteria bacterium]|nr:response regulator [Candidatus Poribacteria bacterium]
PDGVMWFGTWEAGISRYDGSTFVNFTTEEGLADNGVMAIHQDADGIMWFGTNGGGVSRYDGKEFVNFTTENGLASNAIRAVYCDLDGQVWFGTYGAGISRYDGQKFVNLTTDNGLVSNYVTDIYRDSRGMIWFATYDGGVSRYDGKTFVNFTTKNGLASNDVASIHETPDGVMWFGTRNGGVSIYDGTTWSSLDTRDGLTGDTVSAIYQDLDGLIWLGTEGGVTRYQQSTVSPKVQIVSVQTTEFDAAPTEVPSITSGTRVTIKYHALDFKTPLEKRQYQYRIKEVDNGWRQPTKATAFDYTFKKSGTYTFAVRAIDQDLNYSEPASVTLKVVPPWYLNGWISFPSAGGVLALLVSSVVFGGRYYAQRRQMLEQERHNRLVLEAKNAELTEAKDAAEAATHVKSAFLANMSHEIRTPLSGVVGFTELTLDTELAPNQRGYLETVKASADALLILINDILDLSKIEAGKLELDPIDFHLRDTLGNTMHTLGLRADQKGLELALHVRSDVPDALVGDSGRLRQIIVNLVGNAVKFTEQGEIVVRVEIESETENDALLHFAVTDTGIGIPPDRQAEIFRDFEQVDASTTSKYGGTGLGLSISKQLAERLGGEMWVESEVGVGSTFHFTAHLGRQDTLGDRGSSEVPERVQGLRCIAVDDNATHQGILEEMMTNWQMKPTVIEDAQSALSAMKQANEESDSFSLAIIDINMPETDGITLVEWMRSDPQLRETPVVILTSASHEHDLIRYQQLGIVGQAIKPIKPSALLEAIINALDPSAARHVSSRSLAESTGAAFNKSLHILVAEDNAVNQQMLTIRLKQWGHTFVVANNGKEALAALEKESFDVLLTDIQMPEMDGYQATRTIREKEKTTGKHLPIIALTASVMQADISRCLEAGTDSYVSKPIQTAELIEAIKKIVPESAGTQMTTTTEPPPEPVVRMEALPVFDRAEFLDGIGGDMALAQNLVRLFLDRDAPRLLAELQEAISRRDANAIASAAHGLKGLVGEFCAKPTFDAALKLETMGRESDLSHLDEASTVFDAEIEKLKTTLIAFVEEISVENPS